MLISLIDIDECEDETICGKHGYCENTDGSYRCQCDRGYTNSPEDQVCVGMEDDSKHLDINASILTVHFLGVPPCWCGVKDCSC